MRGGSGEGVVGAEDIEAGLSGLGEIQGDGGVGMVAVVMQEIIGKEIDDWPLAAWKD